MLHAVSALRCQNVVLVLSACYDPSHLVMIMEYMEGGSLNEWLAARKSSMIWAVRGHTALDVARGMQFLHEHKIVHRDLKSLNILVRCGASYVGGVIRRRCLFAHCTLAQCIDDSWISTGGQKSPTLDCRLSAKRPCPKP